MQLLIAILINKVISKKKNLKKKNLVIKIEDFNNSLTIENC